MTPPIVARVTASAQEQSRDDCQPTRQLLARSETLPGPAGDTRIRLMAGAVSVRSTRSRIPEVRWTVVGPRLTS
jgi:hypothetical protein